MSITETVPKIALKDMVFRKNEELLTIFHTILEEVKKPINHEKTCRAGTTGKWINVRTFLDVRILLRTYGIIIKNCPSGFRTDS
ncbi:hypothetical protein LEP1GSC128_1372 [Leptospira borgpetersenii str. 200801926]|uniref:Uncharacterized protein n=2 Tax=Leptospira borgpetersenii TaxID=174 RepID=M3HNG9_LEPBO|nr:hypothetical protein LEP1GSC128_1372 [Leptospira borgpetersenii str. 200801926]EMF99600.1 hypothetical protein LEP1GSC123_2864 [Leptospira borgpetersenii str. 200701203]EMK08556.1 hypothetical protein LEP1GSC066_0092 [Leptospira sp. serovar Kenya str. Sh9]EMN11881.1 hypothetical protein LEP1GSC055_1051 [Leptospira borgpetersenii str. Brem 307]KGE22762.1 hypothetical protein IQ66_14760 [Leptospira borgpetersenii serovar Ballum]